MQVGDIVKYKYPDCDDVPVVGIIIERKITFCLVLWFDEHNVCEHDYFQLIKVS